MKVTMRPDMVKKSLV